MVRSEAVQLPVARGCTYRKFLRASSSFPGLRAAREDDGDGELSFSFSTTGEKMDTHRYRPQPGPVPEGTTGAALLICTRAATPKFGCDGKSEDQPQEGCSGLQSCHSADRQRTCSSRSGLQPQSHMYDIGPEQDWGRQRRT